MAAGKYRINVPTIALFLEEGRYVAHSIPAGAVITVEQLLGVEEKKFVAVTWKNRKVLMFNQDLWTRCEQLRKIAS